MRKDPVALHLLRRADCRVYTNLKQLERYLPGRVGDEGNLIGSLFTCRKSVGCARVFALV